MAKATKSTGGMKPNNALTVEQTPDETGAQAVARKAEAGDLAMASHILAAQAVTLDSMFTELARHPALNMRYLHMVARVVRKPEF